jgi:hypothetical protein
VSALANLLGIALVVGTGLPGAAEQTTKIAVIVSKSSRVEHVSKDDLRELYLRRRRLWDDGERVLPVNLPSGNPVRERFSRLVLGRSSQELVAYWNARYFEGITPPAVLPTPAAVRAYVADEPNAIGYVPADEAGTDCRVVMVLE